VIIVGVRGRGATLGGGQFYCPRCQRDRPYTRTGIRRWFTLFFVPMFPISSISGARVCCDTCKGAFSDEVLALPSAEAFRELLARAFQRCAVAILRAGDASSQLARSSARAAIDDIRAGSTLDDGELDQQLAEADPSQLAAYASPVANRLSPSEAERFFGDCAKVALADGPLTPGERDALRLLGASLNLSEAHQLGVIEMLRTPVGRAAVRPSDRT
jgi:tellurite resistance protein TerB